MTYVDGFLTAVPTANKEAYLKLAATTASIFKKHGALNVVECWGDDVPDGKLTSFPMAVQCKEDETVVFSWITWPSKQARDQGLKKTMEAMQELNLEMPFDGKRMVFGGFETIVDK